MKVLIFGATGGIGSELLKLYKDQKVVGLGSSDLNFYDKNFKNNLSNLGEIRKLLDESNIVINASGWLGSDKEPYDKIFDINFNSNWVMINYFKEHPPKVPKKFIMIGSMAYNHGRDDHMLYSASKAAVYNLFLSGSIYFKDTNLVIGIVNPPRVRTKMTVNFKTVKSAMSAEECAEYIFDFIKNLTESKSIDLI